MVEDGHGRIEEVSNMEITPTLLGLATFITRFDSPESLRIKQKFCSLCDCVCGRTGILGVRKDNDVRRNILDTVVEWIIPPEVSACFFWLLGIKFTLTRMRTLFLADGN